MHCPDGYDTTGRFRGAEIGAALYDRAEAGWRLIAKNSAAASWGNWGNPPNADTLQVTWLRKNVALVASGVMMSGPAGVVDGTGKPNPICYYANKRLVGMVVAMNLVKEVLELDVNAIAAPCPNESALFTATLLLNQGATAVRALARSSDGLPDLEIVGLESVNPSTVRFRRFQCQFLQGKYGCQRR